MPLKDQHDKPGGFLRKFLEEVFKAEAHKVDVLSGLLTVGTSERRYSREKHVREHAH